MMMVVTGRSDVMGLRRRCPGSASTAGEAEFSIMVSGGARS